jgi:hypothetical protein
LPSGLEVTHAASAGEEGGLEGGFVDGIGGGLDGLGGGLDDRLIDGLDDRLVDGVGDVWPDAPDAPVMFAVFGAGLPAATCPLQPVAIRHSTTAASAISTLEYL